LNKGVNAFRATHFQEAIDHFQQAAVLDPKLLNARLYLAMSYFQQYAPGGDSADNKKIGQQAVDAFKNVLELAPNNSTALAYIGLLYFNMKDLDNAKDFEQRRQSLDPNNPEPYYWIGVIDYLHCVKNQAAARNSDVKLATPDKNGDLPPLPEKLRTDLDQQNAAAVQHLTEQINQLATTLLAKGAAFKDHLVQTITGSHTLAGRACIGLGSGPTTSGRGVGVAKAYCTRVGGGPFPSELLDEVGERLRTVGREFGVNTGRPRRA